MVAPRTVLPATLTVPKRIRASRSVHSRTVAFSWSITWTPLGALRCALRARRGSRRHLEQRALREPRRRQLAPAPLGLDAEAAQPEARRSQRGRARAEKRVDDQPTRRDRGRTQDAPHQPHRLFGWVASRLV